MSVAADVWCGAGSPVVQGVVVGLGAVAVGIAVFPLSVRLVAPPSGQARAGFARARQLVRWARRVVWMEIPLVALSIVGYLWIYVRQDGKFCDATLKDGDELLVLGWAGLLALTLALVAGLAWVRLKVQMVSEG